MWDAFVELIRVTIYSTASICGGSLGAGIIAVSAALRLGLLPLTLRLARQAREQQAKIAALKPQLDALKRRHATDPARLITETQALYRANDIRLVTSGGVVGLLIQLPLLSALFAAVRAGLGARVRFLWIGNLALPDAILTAVVTLLAAGTMLLMPRPASATGTSQMVAMPLIVSGATLVFLWSASSAVALSIGAGSLVSGLQSWILARDAKPRQA